MIRGPVLPQLRATLWAHVVQRLDAIERGLALVFEGIDCSGGQFGLVDGLARDAAGAPVLLLVAVDGDGQLAARVHSACEFLSRVGESLASAVPEANLCPGARGRVLVVATDAGESSVELLRRFPLPGLHICRLESFRIGGSERFTVRWLAAGSHSAGDAAPPAAASPEFEIPAARSGDWAALRSLCERIDPAVRLDGDRFSRRITWHGRLLGRVDWTDGELQGVDADGRERALFDPADVRSFVDRLLRRYVQVAGIGPAMEAGGGARSPERLRGAGRPADDAAREPQGGGGSLRATMSAARLSAEEYSALGGPTGVASGAAEGGNVADDVARIVAARESPWPSPRRTD